MVPTQIHALHWWIALRSTHRTFHKSELHLCKGKRDLGVDFSETVWFPSQNLSQPMWAIGSGTQCVWTSNWGLKCIQIRSPDYQRSHQRAIWSFNVWKNRTGWIEMYVETSPLLSSTYLSLSSFCPMVAFVSMNQAWIKPLKSVDNPNRNNYCEICLKLVTFCPSIDAYCIYCNVVCHIECLDEADRSEVFKGSWKCKFCTEGK